MDLHFKKDCEWPASVCQVPRRSYQSSSPQQRLDILTGAIVYKDPVLVEMKITGFAWMGGA
jgi:hypothetical protein